MELKTTLKGEVSLFAAATIFAFVSLSVKFAAGYYSGLFVSASRFAIGALLCLGFLALRKPAFDRAYLKDVLLRGLFSSLSMIATYIAIGLTGPGRATLLSNTYPLFVSIFGALLFGEALRGRLALSLAMCTAGAFLVMRDGSGASLSGDLLALAGSVLAGLSVNFVRRASSGGVDPFILYLAPCVFGLPLFAAAPLPGGSGGVPGLLLLAAVGGGAFFAQTLMARGYRTVSAGRGSLVFYWETALTILLGALFAGESLNLRFGVGFALILLGLWMNKPASPRPR